MNKFKVILILILAINCAKSQHPTNINGTISNPVCSKIELFFYEKITNEKIMLDTCILDNSGNFVMNFILKDAKNVFLFYGEEYVKIYLSPGDNLTIDLIANKFDESVKYSGIGSDINNYYLAKFQNNSINFSQLIKLKENDFTHILDSTYQAKILFCNNYFATIKKNKNLESFLNLERAEIKYEWALRRLTYPKLYSNFYRLKKPLILFKTYFEFEKYVSINDSSALNSYKYLEFVINYIDEKANYLANKDSSDIPQQEKYLNYKLELLGKIKNQEIKDFLSAQAIYYKLQFEYDLKNSLPVLEKLTKAPNKKSYVVSLIRLYKKIANTKLD